MKKHTVMPFLLLAIVGFTAVPAETAVYHVGRRIPGASDDNPGTAAKPWKTIGRAAEILKPGDTVIIHAGVYRETVKPRRSGESPERMIAYEGAPGEEVVIKGSVELKGWRKSADGFWVADGWNFSAKRFKGYRGCFRYRSEQLFLDGRPLLHLPDADALRKYNHTREALTRLFSEDRMKELFDPKKRYKTEHLVDVILDKRFYARGAFAVDYSKKRILVKTADERNLNRASLEASVLPYLFDGRGRSFIAVRRLRMRHCAQRHFQNGALTAGRGWIIEDCEVSFTAGRGVSLAGAALIRRVQANNNGCLGFGGAAMRIEDCITNFNNYKEGGWLTGENGGWKMVYAKGAVILRHTAVANRGPGIWLDIDNQETKIHRCFCADNTGAGIFIEISGQGGIEVADNLCVGNGSNMNWGGAGILLGESCNVKVANNLVVGNKEGVAVRMQGPRKFFSKIHKTYGYGEDREVSYYTHDIVIRDNIIAHNGKYQVIFYGDNPFFGPHPNPKVNEREKRKPTLDPEKLNIVLDRNLYYGSPSGGLILYGPGWRPKHRKYSMTELGAWQASTKFDHNSVVADPLFVDRVNGDYRLRAASPAIARKAGLRALPVGMMEIVAER